MTGTAMVDVAQSRYVANQVLTASAAQRLLMLYERALGDLRAAEAGFEAGSIQAIHDALLHAQRIVLLLHDSLLTGDWDAAPTMRGVYRFVHNRLVQCNMTKNPSLLPLCVEVLTRFYEANAEAAAKESGALEEDVDAA